MSDLAVVALLAHEWGRWTREPDFPFSPDHCINGTRVAIRALAAYGIHARPVSVDFVLFNKPALELYAKGVLPADWPYHAHSVGVDPDDESKPGRWAGHLVCEGEGWTLDISAEQYHRPGRIRIDGPRVIPDNLPAPGTRAHFTDDYDQTLWIGRRPDNNLWRQSPGWRRLHAEEAAELLRRMSLNDRRETP